MKRVFVTLSLVGILIACGNQNESEQSGATNDAAGGTDAGAATEAPATAATPSPTDNPDYARGLELEAKSDCATCHKIDERLVGPGFKEIATRYANASEATIDTLAGKIINGGAGNWGQVPMSPHPGMSKDDAKAIVKYILLLK